MPTVGLVCSPRQAGFSVLCVFPCSLNWQDTESRGCLCFCTTDPLKHAFEFCTEIARMRIMHFSSICFQTELLASKATAVINLKINIEINITIFGKLTRKNILFHLEFIVYNACSHIRVKLWLTKMQIFKYS